MEKKLHPSLEKILNEMNSEQAEEEAHREIEDIIRQHLELALKLAGEDIEDALNLKGIVVSLKVKELCVYCKKEDET